LLKVWPANFNEPCRLVETVLSEGYGACMQAYCTYDDG